MDCEDAIAIHKIKNAKFILVGLINKVKFNCAFHKRLSNSIFKYVFFTSTVICSYDLSITFLVCLSGLH